MKPISTAILCASLLFLAGCGDTSPPNQVPDCPERVREFMGYHIPSWGQSDVKVSPNHDKIAFPSRSLVAVMDLRTAAISYVDLKPGLPDSVQVQGVTSVAWCPYNADRMLVTCYTMTDTGVTAGRRITAVNSYIVDITTGKTTRATPEIFSKYGGDPFTSTWLPGSTQSADSFVVTTKSGYYLYLLQENRSIDAPDDMIGVQFSPKGKNSLGFIHVSRDPFPHLGLNKKEIMFPDGNMPMYSISWSPDEKRIAITVIQASPTSSEIWILDLEQYKRDQPAVASVRKVNFRKAFCKYVTFGLFAEYVTNSTLVVTMHADADEGSPLWEITEEGKIVRQLTFGP